MIISASYRTDIPAFYGDWFNRRLDAGFCAVKNPYSNRINQIWLDPAAVDGFVFWTRRLGPFVGTLDRLRDQGAAFMVHYTITGYPRALEPAVIDWRRAVEEAQAMSQRYGRRVIVWRYDPVLLTDQTPESFHIDQVGALSQALAGSTDEMVLSFAQIYRKTRRNTERAAITHGFEWSDPDPETKQRLLSNLGDIAAGYDIRPTLCSQPVFETPALVGARCIDVDRLSDIAGIPLAARTKGNRPGCLCAESRDIGAYDSCPHGCVYCYAVTSQDAAKRRYRAHDPDSEILIF